jgi:hypothetical protein
MCVHMYARCVHRFKKKSSLRKKIFKVYLREMARGDDSNVEVDGLEQQAFGSAQLHPYIYTYVSAQCKRRKGSDVTGVCICARAGTGQT